MKNIIADNSERNEDLNQRSMESDTSVNKKSAVIDSNRIANVCGIIGGSILFILNISTKGKVPGGFIGGFIGYLIGYGIAWAILSIASRK
ncbi:MAG: hypothetical protein HGGPFJEG_01173 [Ignavibacteria bacterium]|nr:hypothetical protein [Ignavibacteria bacterium]